MTLTRRQFSLGSGAFGLVGLAAPSIVGANTRQDWSIAVTGPTRGGHIEFITRKIVEEFNRRVNGRFSLTVTQYPNGQDIGRAIARGQIGLATLESLRLGLDLPLAALLADGVPAGADAAVHRNWLNNDGKARINRILRDTSRGTNRLITTLGGTYGKNSGGWFRAPVRAQSDFLGLKVVVNRELPFRILRRLDAIPLSLPAAEFYAALQTGVIDAAYLSNMTLDEDYALHEVTTQGYISNVLQPTTALHLVARLEDWQNRPPAFRSALTAAGLYAHNQVLRRFRRRDTAAIRRIRESGTPVSEYSAGLKRAMTTASNAEMRAIASTDADFRRVWRSHRAFLEALA